ncbi:ThiF family adenylyltransferase [Psychrobacter cryohalolentis]|uniref:ThiF family adenylyltransferase n=1 Tax=Psychrobacter cryohalolentis TaxID=330922 RepID=UPI003F86837D
MSRTKTISDIRDSHPDWLFARRSKPVVCLIDINNPPDNKGCFDTWTLCVELDNNYKIEILLQVSDWGFVNLPTVYIKTIPTEAIENILPSPHLSLSQYALNGEAYHHLCFALANTIVFDKSNKLAIMQYCFEQCKHIVTKLFTDHGYRAADTMQELPFIWSNAAANNALKYLHHLNDDTSLYSNPKHKYHHYATLHVDKDVTGFHALRLTSTPLSFMGCVINLGDTYKSHCLPNQFIADESLNGISFRVFSNWLKAVSVSAYNQLEKSILSYMVSVVKANQKPIEYFTGCLIIDTETLAFRIDLSVFQTFIDSDKSKRFNSKNKRRLLNETRLFLLGSENYTPHHIFKRSIKNLEQPSLIDKNVLVIGGGAIGGYILLSLARLGAGAGGGKLTIIDNDDLSIENLGRHVLGQNYIGKNKATALKEEVNNQLPNMTVAAYPHSILNRMDIMQGMDLIIDATADSYVSQCINEAYHNLDTITVPIISAWIRNNGECVQSLFHEKEVASACRSCVSKNGYHMRKEYDALFENRSTITALQACRDYTPYAVSSSMSTASLVTDMVLDWLKGEVSPRYRTRYSEKWHGKKLQSADFLPHEDCHVCARL